MQVIDELKQEIYFKLDMNHRITYIDEFSSHFLGYSREELIDKDIHSFLLEESIFHPRNFNVSSNFISFIKKDSTIAYLKILWKNIFDKSNTRIGLIGTMTDSSELFYTKEKYNSINHILENTNDILYKYQLYPHRKFVYLSKAVEQILGSSVETHLNNPNYVFETAHPDDLPILKAKITGKLCFDKPIIMRWIHEDGHIVWFEEYCRPEYNSAGQLIAIEGICRDVTEQKNLTDRLHFLTFHDQLTNCKNRCHYEEEYRWLNSLEDHSVGLIVADIDNLKITNDILGHKSGDRLIQMASELLITASNNKDAVSRIGGDEFIVLLKDISYEDLLEIEGKLKLLLHSQNETPSVYLSFGTSYSQSSINNMDLLFQEADKKMYNSKFKNKNKYKL